MTNGLGWNMIGVKIGTMPSYPVTVAEDGNRMQNDRHGRIRAGRFMRESATASGYSAVSRRLRVRDGSTGMPGPVVDATVTFLM
jgi:hypothetical protein